MKKFICSLLFLCLIAPVAWGNVKIDGNNFPDDTFRQYVSENFDTDGNRELSNSEINSVEKIDVNGKGISSLEGIKFFASLQSLSCPSNELEEADLSGNPKLTYINLTNNKLKTLDISKNSALSEIYIYHNRLTGSLDMSRRSNLAKLYCYGNKLETLNVESCTALEELSCFNNVLTSLNITGCSGLKTLYCDYNRLTELNLGDSPMLEVLHCNNNSLEALDVSNTKITELNCANNAIRTLVPVSSLKVLNFDANSVSEINLSKCTDLTELRCFYNRLSELDLTSNTKLASLFCAYNNLSSINLKGLTVTEGNFSNQLVNALKVTNISDKSYSYQLDFNDYEINDLGEIGSVQAFDENNNEIETVFSSGIAKFALKPARVKYIYAVKTATGIFSKGMDVTIGTSESYPVALRNHVYRVFTETMTWEEAKAYCEKYGGHLATVNNQEEKELIWNLIAEADAKQANKALNILCCWIGAEKVDDNWQWINNENFDKSVVGKIDDPYGNKQYEGFNYLLAYSGGFIAEFENDQHGFICEWEPVEAEFAKTSELYLKWSEDHYAISDDKGHYFGAIPDPVDYSHLVSNPPKTGSVNMSVYLAASVSDREYDPRGLGYLPAAKNQSDYGTCWAFASLGALEISYAKQFGVTAPDLSELYHAWFVYKDPTYSFKVENPKEKVLNQGGRIYQSTAFLSRTGTTYESTLPYRSAPNVESITRGKDPKNDYVHPIRLKTVYKLPSLNTSSYRTLIKEYIMKYGAVVIAYHYNADYGYNNNHTAYYLSDRKIDELARIDAQYKNNPNYQKQLGGHAVEIVGWNDDYSPTNFRITPSQKGAWLIKNSHGTAHNGDCYFWMSYSQTTWDDGVFVASDRVVQSVYGHDMALDEQASPLTYRWSANIFQASKEEVIDEVSFYVADNNVTYEVYLEKYGTIKPANPGVPQNLAEKGSVNAGYHTISLKNPVKVGKGEYFSVILHLNAPSGYRYNTFATYNPNLTADNVNIAGKSYFAMENKDGTPTSKDWSDGYTVSGNMLSKSALYRAPIKAFVTSKNDLKVTPDDGDNGSGGGSSGGGGCEISAGTGILFALVVSILKKRK